MEDLSLAKRDAIRLALERAQSVQEVKQVLDMAKAAQVYVREQRFSQTMRLDIAECEIRAERKLGQMLQAAKATGQITHDHGNQYKNRVLLSEEDAPVKLSKIGISYNLSSRAQQLADLAEDRFEQRLAEQRQAGKLSVKKVLSSGENPAPIKPEARKPGPAGEVEIQPEVLSLTAQEKLNLAIKQHLRKLDQEFEAKLLAATHRYLELKSADIQKQLDESKKIIQCRKGFLTKAIYKKIQACLHPDWVTDEKQKKRYEDAFRELTKLEKCILDEKESPTQLAPRMPRSAAEWEELRRQETQARKAQRKSKADSANGSAIKKSR